MLIYTPVFSEVFTVISALFLSNLFPKHRRCFLASIFMARAAFSCSGGSLRNYMLTFLPVSIGDVLNVSGTVDHQCEYDDDAEVHCLYTAVVVLTEECLHYITLYVDAH